MQSISFSYSSLLAIINLISGPWLFHYRISNKRSYLVCNFLKLFLVCYQNAFETNSNYSVYQRFGFFSVFHCKNLPEFIFSPVEIHLDCFQFRVIMSKATVNIHAQIFEHTLLFLLGKCLQGHLYDHIHIVSIYLTS